MARPAGVARATKDNSKKQPYKREQWMKAKRANRPRQMWSPELGWAKIDVDIFHKVR